MRKSQFPDLSSGQRDLARRRMALQKCGQYPVRSWCGLLFCRARWQNPLCFAARYAGRWPRFGGRSRSQLTKLPAMFMWRRRSATRTKRSTIGMVRLHQSERGKSRLGWCRSRSRNSCGSRPLGLSWVGGRSPVSWCIWHGSIGRLFAPRAPLVTGIPYGDLKWSRPLPEGRSRSPRRPIVWCRLFPKRLCLARASSRVRVASTGLIAY